MATIATDIKPATKANLDTFKPLYDRVVVRLDPVENTLGNGTLVVADEYAKRPLFGTVVSVGCGYPNADGSLRRLLVQPKDRISFGVFSGVEMPDLGDDIKVMREEEIMGIL